MKTASILLAMTLLAGVRLHAQFVADGATNTLSNVTNNLSTTMTVGTNGSFTLLVLADNCLLTNSGQSASRPGQSVLRTSATSSSKAGVSQISFIQFKPPPILAPRVSPRSTI